MSALLNRASELWSARLREAVARGLRRGIDRQRAGEIPGGGRRISRLETEKSGVDVTGCLTRVAADRRLEGRERAIALAGGGAGGAEQALCARVARLFVHYLTRDRYRFLGFATEH